MQVSRERILITVKTYPVLSSKYLELVCTAGIREDGSWVRIYPIPFRVLPENERFRKYDWVECELRKRKDDKRPESFSPVDLHSIVNTGRVDTAQNWYERRKLILERAKVYRSLKTLIDEANSNKTSLAVFKPTRILKFEANKSTANWEPKKLSKTKQLLQEYDLFDDNSWRDMYDLPTKIPFDFYYHFEDERGQQSKMKIHDWEIGMLYLNCLQRAQYDQETTLEKVREKYHIEFMKTDLHLFLGTTLGFHDKGANPFTIVGVFPIPPKSPDLFD